MKRIGGILEESRTKVQRSDENLGGKLGKKTITQDPSVQPRISHNQFPSEIGRTIFEYVTAGISDDYPKFSSLLALKLVCKPFNIAFDKMVEERLLSKFKEISSIVDPTSSNRDKEISTLLGSNLPTISGQWSLAAIYYSFASNFLCENSGHDNEIDSTLSNICQVTVEKMKQEIVALSSCQLDTIDSGFKIIKPFNDDRIIKFNECYASIIALRWFIEALFSKGEILKVQRKEQTNLIEFLCKHHQKENFINIINWNIYCLYCYNREYGLSDIFSFVDFMIFLLQKNLVNSINIYILIQYILETLNIYVNPHFGKVEVLRLFNFLLKTKRVQLNIETIQFLKRYIFVEFFTAGELLIQRQDAVLTTVLELIALGYGPALALNYTEIQILKNHAIKRLAYDSGGIDFKHNNIEILSFLSFGNEWVFLISASTLQYIHERLMDNYQFSPLMIERLLPIYGILVTHPEEQIRILAIKIYTSIKCQQID